MAARFLKNLPAVAVPATLFPAHAQTQSTTNKATKPFKVEKVTGSKLKRACRKNQQWDASAGKCVDAPTGHSVTPIPIPGTH